MARPVRTGTAPRRSNKMSRLAPWMGAYTLHMRPMRAATTTGSRPLFSDMYSVASSRCAASTTDSSPSGKSFSVQLSSQ